MIDKNQYLEMIKHSPDKNGECELTKIEGFKIDGDGIKDSKGIGNALGFESNELSRVDYFIQFNLLVVLIEMSDLKDSIKKNCDIEETIKLSSGKSKITKEERKEIWKDLTFEFIKKWSGSIAIMERFYRKTNELSDNDPNYKLVIVCKKGTDIQMLDSLKTYLIGNIGLKSLCICNTNDLENIIEKFKLC